MTPRAVLLAEHEPEVAELARRYLVRAGLRVTLAATAEETMAALSTWSAGVAVLDLTMPGLDARRVRRLLAEPVPASPVPVSPLRASPVPASPVPVSPLPALPAPTPAVFLVGASMRPRDLRVSADHCLRRPFSPRMLVSRVLSAAARPAPRSRPATAAPSTTSVPGTTAVPGTIAVPGTTAVAPSAAHASSLLAHLAVSIAPGDIALTPAEFALLSALAAQSGRVLSRDRLRAALGPADRPSSSRAVDVHIAQLRAKLGAELGAAIRTVRGVGYVLDAPLNGAHTSSNRGVPATPLMPPR